MSIDAARTVIAPEQFVHPDRRLFIDTNVFMDTNEGRAAGLKKLFERCKDVAVANGNGIVVPTKVIDELAKQSRLDTAEFTDERAAAVRKAGQWLTALESGAEVGLIRKDLGDGSNPYADDLFVDLFTRFGEKYEMCLVTNDITLRLRIRLLEAERDHRLVAGTLMADGRIEVDSDQALYARGARKLTRMSRHVDEGIGTGKDRNEVAILNPLLEIFRQTFKLEAASPKPGDREAPKVTRRANSASRRPESGFRKTDTLKPKDEILGGTTIPGWSDAVTAESPLGRRTLVLGELLGEGGEGRVYAVHGDCNQVVKIFDREHRTRHRNEKLRLLMSHQLESPGIAFPTSVITNGADEFVGYAMPRASGKELQATIMRPARFKRTYPTWTKADLVDVCISFLEKVAHLHSLNILLGDINPKNLMVTETKDVWIIDADSWQLEGYPCPVGTPMFTAPTITGGYADRLRTMDEELFAVATMLFMILITGQFPYARAGADGGDFPALIREGKFAFQFRENSDRDQPGGNWKYMWSHLPFPVKRTFWNTFHRDGDRYTKRPTAREWLRIFREYKQFFGGSDDFDPMSNDVYPTRYRAMNRETPIYRCAKCQTSMVGRWQEDRKTFWEPELCGDCYQNLPRCEGCGKPKPPHSLSNGRCWTCNRERDEELDPAKLCRDCGQPFITFKHARWFTSRDYEIPKSHGAIRQQCPPRLRATNRQRPPVTQRTSRRSTISSVNASSAAPRKSLWTRFHEWLNS